MGYMIEIEKADAMELSGHIEKGLHHLGRAMSIVEEMCGNGMNYRNGYRGGYRDNYGYQNDTGYQEQVGYRDGMNYRESEGQYDDWGNPKIGMRGRSRNARGQFM